MKTFDLDRWFDTRGEIDSVQAALTEAQLMLEAVKNGIDPAGAEAHQQYRTILASIKVTAKSLWIRTASIMAPSWAICCGPNPIP
jgi:hypothetical protein